MKGLYHIMLPGYIGIYIVTSITYSQGLKGYTTVCLSAPSENNKKYHTDLVSCYNDKLNMI